MAKLEGIWRINYMTCSRSGLALVILESGKLKGADSHGNEWDGIYNTDGSTVTLSFNVHYNSGISVLSDQKSSKPWTQKYEITLPYNIIENNIYTTDAVGKDLLHIVMNKLRS